MSVICLSVKIGLVSLHLPAAAAAQEIPLLPFPPSPSAASAVLIAVTSSIASEEDLGLVGGDVLLLLLLLLLLVTSCRRRFIRLSSSLNLLAISPGLSGVSLKSGVLLEEEAAALPRPRFREELEGDVKRPPDEEQGEEESESNKARLKTKKGKKWKIIDR